MRRSTLFSGPFSYLKAGFAGALALVTILSCADNTTAPDVTAPSPLGGYTVMGQVADSLKHSIEGLSSSIAFVAPHLSNAMLAAPAPASVVSSSTPTYTVSSVPFTPAPAPAAVPSTFVLACDDCTHFRTEMGFDFTFYGRTYHQVNIVANGFVAFDSVNAYEGGCCEGGMIPFGGDAPYNNLIAIAWTDLNAGAAGANVRAETQGTAPHRKFVVQFNNVPEYSRGPGKVTAQLVLEEGSNDITIYTWSQNILTNPYHFVTQGIENADGSEAEFLPGRVHAFFGLSNDAVRFSLAHVNQPPVIVAPPNLAVTTAPPALAASRLASTGSAIGTCAAIVNPGLATATDDADGVAVAGTRSDGLALGDAYPKGTTTINWIATDAGGLTASASQTVTVDDKENPSVSAPADISTRIAHGATSTTVVVGTAVAADNCPDVKVAGARSDGADLSAPYPVGLTTVKWTATDASGNTGSADQKVAVIANTPPVIAAPVMLVFNTDPGVCAALINVATPGVTDDIAGSTILPARSDGLPLSAAYPKGITSIIWTATDVDGATSSASQTVTVNDGEKPSISRPADVSSGNDPGLASAVVALGKPAAVDNCHEVTVEGVRNDGALLGAPYNVGVTTINWTARDAAGNTAAVTQAITVLDVEAPTITVPANITVNATSPSGAVANYRTLFSDNVLVTAASCTPASGSMFPIGPTPVTCTASDAAGHLVSKGFTVTVVGPEEQLGNLITYVLTLDLPNGTANPLVAQLRAAFRAGTNQVSCTKMSDFIDLAVKKGAPITGDELSYMTSEASRIMGAMGCSSGPVAVQLPRASF